jgi:hypothetical protein
MPLFLYDAAPTSPNHTAPDLRRLAWRALHFFRREVAPPSPPVNWEVGRPDETGRWYRSAGREGPEFYPLLLNTHFCRGCERWEYNSKTLLEKLLSLCERG